MNAVIVDVKDFHMSLSVRKPITDSQSLNFILPQVHDFTLVERVKNGLKIGQLVLIKTYFVGVREFHMEFADVLVFKITVDEDNCFLLFDQPLLHKNGEVVLSYDSIQGLPFNWL